MQLETNDELAAMIEKVDGNEPFLMESGERFMADYDRPQSTDNRVRGFNPSITVTSTVAQRLTLGCDVWREETGERFEIGNQDPFGDDSFVIVDLLARD